MAKSNMSLLDKTVAGELDLTLSDKMITLKHVVPSMGVTGFYFVFLLGDHYWVDYSPIWNDTLGLRKRPERFFLPSQVRLRLQQHAHTRWYVATESTLHPMHHTKLDKLEEAIWFVDDESPLYRPLPLVNVELFYLRKKPLLPMRQTLRWDSIKDPIVKTGGE